MDITAIITNIATPKGFVALNEFFVISILIIYVFYAFIVSRQVDLMNKSFVTPVAGLFKFLALIHFASSVGIVLLAIILT